MNTEEMRYDELGLSEVIQEAVKVLNADMARIGYDTFYVGFPGYSVLALQMVMNKAEDLACDDNLPGFAFASAILIAIGDGLRTTWPKPLEDRLRGRIAGS